MTNFMKWAYGALAIAAATALIVSFFVPGTKPLTQITLLIQAVGFGFISGLAIGSDM